MNKKILNTKEAIEYLGLGRRSFDAAVKQGDISFKTIGSKRFYPVWVLDKWLNNTVNLLDCSKEATSITPTYRSSAKDSVSGLDALRDYVKNGMQHNSALNALQKYKTEPTNKHQVNFQV